jgi:hypothetical protein
MIQDVFFRIGSGETTERIRTEGHEDLKESKIQDPSRPSDASIKLPKSWL